MKTYHLKRYSQPTLRKVEIEEGSNESYLLTYADFIVFDDFLSDYTTANSIVDEMNWEEKHEYLEKRKNKIRKYYNENLYGFYNEVIDIHSDDLDRRIIRGRREIISDGKIAFTVNILLMFGYVSMELWEKDSLHFFDELADKLACRIGLNVYETNTKHEEIPIKEYFKKEV